MALKLEIPVGAAFEKRLAELIWESSSELARQTAAGRIALAIDVTDKLTINSATDSAIQHAVHKLAVTIIESAKPQLEESGSQDVIKRVKKIVDANVEEISKDLTERADSALDDYLRLFIINNVQPEVIGAVKGFFNDRPIARRVGEVLNQMIKEYLSERLEEEKGSSGILQAAVNELGAKLTQER